MKYFFDIKGGELTPLYSFHKRHILSNYFSINAHVGDIMRENMVLADYMQHIFTMLLNHEHIVFASKHLYGTIEYCGRIDTLDYRDFKYSGSIDIIKQSISDIYFRINKILVVSHVTINEKSNTITGFYIKQHMFDVAYRKNIIDDFLEDNL